MDENWIERWAEGRTGWHEEDGNAGLKRYWQASGKRVLVPLCGKSRDLLWLARQGNAVVGVELSDIAIAAFFEENHLPYRRDGENWHARDLDISIRCGDFFDFEDPAGFDGHFDRGALIALPAGERPRYAGKVASLLARSPYQLIVSLEYDQAAVNGPPFSVAADEVLGYWPQLERVDARDDLENAPPKFREADLTGMREVVWRSPAE
jgi:thiopurine S-methyltransferase